MVYCFINFLENREEKMKKLAFVLSLIMIFTMLLTGCQVDEPDTTNPDGEPNPTDTIIDENTDPFYKYPETVNLTAGVPVYGAASNLPEGDTLEDNEYTKYFEERTNIHVTNKFEAQFGDAYNQKVQLAITSDDLPDFMVIPASQYASFKQAVDYGMLADLTDYYDKYLNPVMKEKYDSGDGSALEQVTFDGKLMALPEPTMMYDATDLLWIRNDWLKNLGLDIPKTVEDVQAVAKAFKEDDPDQNGKDDTISLLVHKDLIRSDNGGLDPLFAAYDSFPKYWYMKDGEVVYGSTTQETRNALEKLAEMYAEGSIDKEFVSRGEVGELIASGENGIFFCPWWAPWSMLGSNVQNNPDADWIAVTAPLNSNGEFVTRVPSPNNSYLVVNDKCENIDAVMRYFNVSTDLNSITEKNIYEGQEGLGESYRLSSVAMVVDYINAIPFKNYYYNKVLDGKAEIGDDEDINSIETQFNIDCINKVQSKEFEISDWTQYAAYLIGAEPLVDNPKLETLEGAFYGTTETMELKWTNLDKIEQETFLNIITGNDDISAFDKFVENWKAQGGDEITKEISDILK